MAVDDPRFPARTGLSVCAKSRHMMAFLALHNDMKRFEDLVSEIEPEDGISNVILWFSRYGKYGKNVVKAAEERLERVRKRAKKSLQAARA